MKDIFWSQPGELVMFYHELLKLKENGQIRIHFSVIRKRPDN